MTPLPDEVPLLAGIRPAPRIRRLTGDWSYATWGDTARLSEDAQRTLAAHLGAMATETFGGDRTGHWLGRCASGYFRRISGFSLILDPGRQVVGAVAVQRQRLAGARCLYLDASLVVPSVQRGGLVSRLQTTMVIREYLRRFPAPLYLLARTGNPVVYRGLRNACGPASVWPAPTGCPPPGRVSAIGAAAARWLGQADRFDPRTFVLRGAYHALYSEIPRCGEADVDDFFAGSLRPDDAYLVVCRLGVSTAVHAWFARSTGRGRNGHRRSDVGPARHPGAWDQPMAGGSGVVCGQGLAGGGSGDVADVGGELAGVPGVTQDTGVQ